MTKCEQMNEKVHLQNLNRYIHKLNLIYDILVIAKHKKHSESLYAIKINF